MALLPLESLPGSFFELLLGLLLGLLPVLVPVLVPGMLPSRLLNGLLALLNVPFEFLFALLFESPFVLPFDFWMDFEIALSIDGSSFQMASNRPWDISLRPKNASSKSSTTLLNGCWTSG